MISILMATYNGEEYISGQIDSLLSQTFSDFTIWISDDASTDRTWDILKAYSERNPEKIKISQRKENSGGAKHNFFEMMLSVKDEYIMLCDQDDVWLPQKIEKTLEAVRQMEMKFGTNMPILVHSDLVVTDQDLCVISDSYLKMAKADSIDSVKQMVLRNNVAGCTTMYNHALATLIKEKPKSFVMHDCWLAQVAFCFGKIACLPHSQILYRQHGGNVLGARSAYGLKHKLYKLTHGNETKETLFSAYRQAGEFLRIYGDELAFEQKKVLMTYAALPSMGKWDRIKVMKKEGLFRKGLMRTFSQVVFG